VLLLLSLSFVKLNQKCNNMYIYVVVSLCEANDAVLNLNLHSFLNCTVLDD